MMKLNKVTDPAFVTESQVISFLDKKGFGRNGTIYVCKDSLSLFTIMGRINAIPGIDFFNNQGKLLVYSDSICPGLAMNFAKKLKADEKYTIDNSYDLEDVINMVKPVGGLAYGNDYNVDFTVVLYWAIFAGKINNNVFEIADELRKNSQLKIRFLFVNVDFQKSWGMKDIPDFFSK